MFGVDSFKIPTFDSGSTRLWRCIRPVCGLIVNGRHDCNRYLLDNESCGDDEKGNQYCVKPTSIVTIQF